jgi:hypothetical protein
MRACKLSFTARGRLIGCRAKVDAGTFPRMKNEPLNGLLIGILIGASVNAATPFTLPSENRIQTSSLELERRTEPWCRGDCAVGVPFVASYRKGTERLVFVGAHHAFQANDPTMRAVKAGFDQFQPKVVILEGFPTAMGENPPPLAAEARLYGTADADEFVRSERNYAASIALAQGVPFIGGEPTREEQTQVLKARGYTDTDLAFSGLLGAYSQALRSGDMPDTSVESLAKMYPRLAEDLKAPPSRGGSNLDAPSLEDFRERYKQMYGVDIVGDDNFPLRIDVVNDPTRHGQQDRIDMMTRDRHLLGLIEQQLIERHSVLVVYGGSHWATLSAALQERLGKPKIRPFLK